MVKSRFLLSLLSSCWLAPQTRTCGHHLLAVIISAMGSDNDKTHDNGLPVMPASEDGGRATKFIVIATVVTLFISGAIGYGIASNGKYDTKIKEIVAQDLHYVFAALVVLSQTVSFVNMYPLIAKSRIMKQNSGNLRTNMAVFKVRTCARSFAWQYKIA